MSPTLLAASVGLLSVSSGFAATVVFDNFSSGSITSNPRFRLNQADLGWHKNASSDWAIMNGMLMNAGNTAGVAAEGAVGQLISVATLSDPIVTVSFDYDVGAGSSLFFHLTGLTQNGSPAANEQLFNPGAQNGVIQNPLDATFGDLSILTGADPGNGLTDAIGFPGASAGTYSATFDLRNYGWSADEAPGLSGSIGDISDFDFIHAAFAIDETDPLAAGGVAIKNFSVEVDPVPTIAIPEPASLPVLSLLMIGSLTVFRRRRSA